MSHQKKRHLSKIQQNNISRHRKNFVSKHQQNIANLETLVSDSESLKLNYGLVVSRYGKSADVMPLINNCLTEQIVRCFMKAALEDLVVGDRVYYYEINAEQNFIIEREERDNLVTRYYFGKQRNVVSNVETMLITSSINPTLNTEIIDRYLIVAKNCNVTPIILINKVDLLATPKEELEVGEIIQTYSNLGYKTLPVSTITNLNIEEIKATLNKGLHIFMGQTGVGKSSLINSIFGKPLMETGEINENTRLGKHTTTASKLFKINNHSALIDSPGIREFSVENYSEYEILRGYVELENPDYACRFSDCNHINNDGCGISRLLKDSKIAPFRYNNLMSLLAQAKK